MLSERKELLDWIDRLVQQQPLIVVEGIKDRAALKELGLTNVLMLRGRPMYAVVEHISEEVKECILLLDLDPEGKKLYGKLKRGLSQRGVRVRDAFRNFLFRKTKLRQIEGLAQYIHHLGHHKQHL